MSRRTVNVGLLVVLALLSGLSVAVQENRELPNFEIFAEMAHSKPADSFAANRVFADGKTLQQPVSGTIPRGYRASRYGPSEEEAIRAGEELTNPFAAEDRAEARRGAELYQSFCSHCHGGGGYGDGAVSFHGFPAPPSLLAQQAKDLPDGRIFHIIAFGQKNMPPHAIQVEPDDRWRIVLHIRRMQQESDEQQALPAPEPQEEPEP